ncbi:hypothetical protein P152DRAFT_516342 [Eremomyces bilateralis CBS 781.70]|uniref:TPR-like protein n=1 Tax=Eremomyces bilateralis CBS 781.70 TaxID=1392243 RepID=A0A6G1FVW4_9PEZI|nr:uncharacterized protein P152DRAFT_516342 [Eremomyces bilateralis CBS 781.70]KAF1809924.1 hypothetical protein P152DRAFT_516342 [Eremomyces bilateralis CBS 781.70]
MAFRPNVRGIGSHHLDRGYFARPDAPLDSLLRWHFRQAVLANMRDAGEPIFEHDFPPGQRREWSLSYLAGLALKWSYLNQLASRDHQNLAEMSNMLSAILGYSYEQIGILDALWIAIGIGELAISITPENHSDIAKHQITLGIQSGRRYERRGQGKWLGRRFERTDDIKDLEDSIRLAEQALDLTPKAHSDRPGYLNSLGVKPTLRYERTGETAGREEAIRAAQQALDSTPDDHPVRSSYLNSLGNKLGRRYERTGWMGDLENAIQLAQLAIDSTPYDHPDRAGYLDNLGNILSWRYERTCEMGDLEVAIQVAQHAVDSTLEDLPDRASRLNSLGNKLVRRHERTGESADLNESAYSFFQAWKCENGVPFHRISAASSGIRALGQLRDYESAAKLLWDAINLLPIVNNRTLEHGNQQ